jgi:hypothetical protein
VPAGVIDCETRYRRVNSEAFTQKWYPNSTHDEVRSGSNSDLGPHELQAYALSRVHGDLPGSQRFCSEGLSGPTMRTRQ